MKTRILILVSLLVLTSCKKKEEDPIACIEGPLTVAEGETVTYKWCGENAKHVRWMTDQSGTTEGEEFTPKFLSRGTFVVTATGVNDKSEVSTSITVEYGKKPEVVCSVYDGCASSRLITNTEFIQNLIAYLYNSKADWVTSVENGNHALAIDSVKCAYSSAYNAPIARFTKSYPTSDKYQISVEYRHPTIPSKNMSNWGNLFYYAGGNAAISNIPFKSDIIEANLYEAPTRVLSGKWKLAQTYINYNNVPVAECNKDDYIKLSANGTWTYNVGADNCNGSSVPSNGTFVNMPMCVNTSMIFNTQSGPFVTTNVEYVDGTLKANFNTGTNFGYFVFTYSQ